MTENKMQIDPHAIKEITDLIKAISTVYPILPIVQTTFKFNSKPVVPKVSYVHTTFDLKQDQANDHKRGVNLSHEIEPFNEFYVGESDCHMDAVFEHYDGTDGMTYLDAVNQSNVY